MVNSRGERNDLLVGRYYKNILELQTLYTVHGCYSDSIQSTIICLAPFNLIASQSIYSEL